jgi:phage gp46-like protein
MLLDLLMTPLGQLDETASLTSAVLIALCSDSLAAPDDQLPDPNSDDRRGWWADENANAIWGGWDLGSRLWLLKRSSITDSGARQGATITRVQQYISNAMQPFVDAKICSQFTVTARQTSSQSISACVTIYRGPKASIALNFQALWSELQANIGT